MNHAERAYLALTSSNRALDSYRLGRHTVNRAAAHMMLVGEHVADVSYWSREAVDEEQMTADEAARIMRIAAANAADMAHILVEVTA
jgi:hypothetical protein